MLEAARAVVRFCCPGCGAGLRATSNEAGSVLPCHLCGEQVRIPRRPHPVESIGDGITVIPPLAAQSAINGIRLLNLSLSLFAVSLVLTGVVFACWYWIEGPTRLLQRDSGSLQPLLQLAWGVELALVCGAAVLRWIGYTRSEEAALAVRASGCVSTARVGLIIRTCGYTLMMLPWLNGYPVGSVPLVMRALADVGSLGWVVGTTLEFGVLVAWYRILIELQGYNSARMVARYAGTTAAAVIAAASGICMTGMVMVLTLRRNGSLPPGVSPHDPPARLNLDVVPTEGWYAAAATAIVIGLFGLTMLWQYSRILRTTQSALSGPTRF